jgi:hypothetical protein
MFSSQRNAVCSSRKGVSRVYDIPEEALRVVLNDISIYWHVDPLLGSDRETGIYTTVIAK